MKKYSYENRKGEVYYFRAVEGKRGVRIVASMKETADDLAALPDGYEAAEKASGQVTCRKKLVSLITPEEFALVETLTNRLKPERARVFCELKKKSVEVHSAEYSAVAAFALGIGGPATVSKHADVIEQRLRFEPALKFELLDADRRVFQVSRMTWRRGCGWMALDMGPLGELVKRYAPHLEQESFFELM